jgi:hypothetical protein
VRVQPYGTYDRAVLSIDETPDPTRPRNVWPRLLAAGATLLLGLLLVGACVAALARSVPERELTVPLAGLELGKPRMLPVTTWGADPDGFTFGAWVVFLPGGDGVRAFLSRDPSSGCHVHWEIVVTNGEARGAFVDRCGGALYDLDGRSVLGSPERALDRFDARISDGTVIVPIERVTLGACDAAADTTDCSSAEQTRYRSLPSGPLEGIAGYRR